MMKIKDLDPRRIKKLVDATQIMVIRIANYLGLLL